MTTTNSTSTTADAASGKRSNRGAAFAEAVSEQKLKTDGASRDLLVRTGGLVAMVAGVAGAFIAWRLSLAESDSRNILSYQLMALTCIALSVLGAGLYVAGALSRVMRLWLLRQVVESQDRHDELIAAIREGKLGG